MKINTFSNSAMDVVVVMDLFKLWWLTIEYYFLFGILFFKNKINYLGGKKKLLLISWNSFKNLLLFFHSKNVLNIFSMLLIDVIWWCWYENMPPKWNMPHMCWHDDKETSYLDKDEKYNKGYHKRCVPTSPRFEWIFFKRPYSWLFFI